LLLFGFCSSVLFSSSHHSYLWHLPTCKWLCCRAGGSRSTWRILIYIVQELRYLCWWFHCRVCNELVVGCGSRVRSIEDWYQ
jgi:hypothetical protein